MALLLLGGCSGGSGFDPVAWWHDLEGGPVADARPPPPNADAPYPNLASVPDRPADPDAARRGQIANALVADRANAQYDASLAPLAAPASGPPRPPKPPAPAPASADASNASLEAASAPPAPPPPPPKRAPAPAVQESALAPPTGTAATAALPEIPNQPPAPPALPGVAQQTAPAPPVATPAKPKPAAAAPLAGTPDAIAFPSGSSALPGSALPGLKALGQQRGGGAIAVVGYGGAADSSPAAQQAALPLALARAKAIAAYLESSGVPASAIRIDAEAAGQGGAARVIH